MVEIAQRRSRVENQTRFTAILFDELQRAIHMFRRFRVEGDDTGSRSGKIRHDTVNRLHHQMDVNRRGNTVVTQRFKHHRANGQIRNVVVIHNVEMDDIRARRECFCSVFTQAGKIGRQN